MSRRHWRHAEPLLPAVPHTAAAAALTNQHTPALRLTALASAALLAAASFGFTPQAHAQPSPAATANSSNTGNISNTTAARDYNLPAGPLDTALSRFAAEAGVLLSANGSLTRGKTAPALKGRYTAEGGFSALLGSSGLQAVRDGSGVFLLRTAPAPMSGSRTVAEQQMSTVTVTGQQDLKEKVYNTPGSVAVVTREEIERLPPRNAGDVLDGVPGVYIANNRSDPGLVVNVRGMQDFGRVNVMIDGARQNYQQSGHGANGTVYLDPELLAGVDVIKGPHSGVGGAGVIGGVVNFRTLELEDIVQSGQSSGGRVNLSSGNNAYHFVGGAAAGTRFGEDLDVVAAISRRKLGDFKVGSHGAKITGVRFADQSSVSGLFKTKWRLAPDQELKFGYVGYDWDATDDQQSSSHIKVNTLQANYSWKPSGNRWIDLQSGLYYTRTSNDEFGIVSNSGSVSSHYETNTAGGSLSNTSSWDGWGMGWRLQSGGEFFHDWTDPGATTTGTVDSRWYTGPTPQGKRTVISGFSELSAAHPSGVEAIAGLRYDWFRLSGSGEYLIDSIENPSGVRPRYTDIYTNFRVRRHAAQFAPKFTLAYTPRAAEALQFFASYGRGLRPPSITETMYSGMHVGNAFPFVANPGLREERSRNTELGVNVKFDGLLAPSDRFRAKAAVFENKVSNYIIQAPVMHPTSVSSSMLGPMGYVNFGGELRYRGFELSLDYDAGVVFGQLSWTRLMADGTPGSYDPFPLGSVVGYPPTELGQRLTPDQVISLPRRKASLTLGTRLLERKLTLGMRARMQRYREANADWTRGSGTGNGFVNWVVYDLWASYQVSRALELRLAVNNVRDVYYGEYQASGTTYQVAPGRTATVSASFRF